MIGRNIIIVDEMKLWAEKMDGREIGNEISRQEEVDAKNDGVVIAYGHSDDVVIFCGAKSGEFNALRGAGIKVSAKWRPKDHPGYSWWIDAPFPHEGFDILEKNGKKFCRGIVFMFQGGRK